MNDRRFSVLGTSFSYKSSKSVSILNRSGNANRPSNVEVGVAKLVSQVVDQLETIKILGSSLLTPWSAVEYGVINDGISHRLYHTLSTLVTDEIEFLKIRRSYRRVHYNSRYGVLELIYKFSLSHESGVDSLADIDVHELDVLLGLFFLITSE